MNEIGAELQSPSLESPDQSQASISSPTPERKGNFLQGLPIVGSLFGKKEVDAKAIADERQAQMQAAANPTLAQQVESASNPPPTTSEASPSSIVAEFQSSVTQEPNSGPANPASTTPPVSEVAPISPVPAESSPAMSPSENANAQPDPSTITENSSPSPANFGGSETPTTQQSASEIPNYTNPISPSPETPVPSSPDTTTTTTRDIDPTQLHPDSPLNNEINPSPPPTQVSGDQPTAPQNLQKTE